MCSRKNSSRAFKHYVCSYSFLLIFQLFNYKWGKPYIEREKLPPTIWTAWFLQFLTQEKKLTFVLLSILVGTLCNNYLYFIFNLSFTFSGDRRHPSVFKVKCRIEIFLMIVLSFNISRNLSYKGTETLLLMILEIVKLPNTL